MHEVESSMQQALSLSADSHAASRIIANNPTGQGLAAPPARRKRVLWIIHDHGDSDS